MKKHIILLIVMTMGSLLTTNVFAQSGGKIIYIFPDEVEVKLYNYIKKTEKKQQKVVLTLYKSDAGIYTVFVNFHKVLDNTSIASTSDKWVKITNRYVVINDMEYPLLLDYDYQFSTSKPSEIGEYGSRNGQVMRTMSINHGFFVRFSGSKILSE